MPSTKSRDVIRTTVLGLLWAQWTELGVAGTRGNAAAVIDPEALLVATLTFGRFDPRLFDEVLDWLSLNGSILDVPRLRRMLRETAPEARRIAAAVVGFMRRSTPNTKWQPTAEGWLAQEAVSEYDSTPLFLASDESALPTFGAADKFFGSRGFERPAFEPRGMSGRPRVSRPSLLRLAARSLAGIGVRSETLVYLWTHETGHGRLISARARYSQRQVADYLAGLAAAGFAERYAEGRTVQYRLVGPLKSAVRDTARYVDWPAAYAALSDLHSGLAQAAREPDPYDQSVAVRASLSALETVLPLEGLDIPLPRTGEYPGERILDYSSSYVEAVCKALERHS